MYLNAKVSDGNPGTVYTMIDVLKNR
jgi:hypothetical protein